MGQVLHSDDWAAASRLESAKLGELGYTSICLAPGEATPGHSHTLVEELTVFRAGSGQIEIENDCYEVCAGSVSVVPAGEYHRIRNVGDTNLEAVIVFNSNIDRKKVALKNRKEHFGLSETKKGKKAQRKAVDKTRAAIKSMNAKIRSLEAELSALDS